MPNVSELNPSQISLTPPLEGMPQSSPDTMRGMASAGNINQIHPDAIQTEEEHFSTPGQQILTGIEGAAKGVLGPVAPAIEQATGLTTGENIRAREAANPITHAVGNVAGLAGSIASGTGLGSLVSEVGEGAAALSGLSNISKIASTGIKTGAELAALQTSDELSKLVTNDPEQTVGSAAINVGLSGLMGGVGGAVIGAVSPLWKTAANKLGVEKLANDFMGENKFLRENPIPAEAAAGEVNSRLQETDELLKNIGNLKGQAIAATLPEMTPQNVGKIDAKLLDIASEGAKRLNSASDNAYLKGAVPKLQQDLKEFLDVVHNPESNLLDKWDALNDYKQATQAHANYNILTGGSEEKAVSKWVKPFAASLREAAEDTKIWGEAGNVQKTVNEKLSDLLQAQKDFLPKITSKELGERIADPAKLQTLINQANKGKASLRVNAVNNYLDATQKALDAINKVHIENGLEAPISSFNPTPVLERSLNVPVSPGRTLAQWAHNSGAATLANATGKTAGGVTGGGLGFLIGHPLAGAWAGEQIMAPIFAALAKPFAETAVNSEAMKAAVTYGVQAAKGQAALNAAAKNFFKAGAEIVPKDLLPDAASRNKLEKSMDAFQVPGNAKNVGGNIGHYLPQHGSTIAATSAQAVNYLNSIKPKQPVMSPLDKKPPIDKYAQNRYERALDIAQQPLLVLSHAKNGTLLPNDVKTLQSVYPGLHSAIVQKLQNELIENKEPIPYPQRVSMNLLMGGRPLDSTMTSGAMQAIMHSAGFPQPEQAAPSKKSSHTSEATLKQVNKVNALSATPLQAREVDKKI